MSCSRSNRSRQAAACRDPPCVRDRFTIFRQSLKFARSLPTDNRRRSVSKSVPDLVWACRRDLSKMLTSFSAIAPRSFDSGPLRRRERRRQSIVRWKRDHSRQSGAIRIVQKSIAGNFYGASRQSGGNTQLDIRLRLKGPLERPGPVATGVADRRLRKPDLNFRDRRGIS